MVVKDGVEFDALDGAPVNLQFLNAAPNTEDNVHLEVLSKLSVLLMDENFTNGLKNAKTVDEFLKVIDDAESSKEEDEKEDETGAKYTVLDVTACQTVYLRCNKEDFSSNGMPDRNRTYLYGSGKLREACS